MKTGLDTYISRYLGLPLLAAALFCSCTDELSSERRPGGGNTAGEQKVTIQLQVPGSSKGEKAATRAVGDTDAEIAQTESQVDDLYIMAFGENDHFMYWKKADETNIENEWKADLAQGGETFLFAANVDESAGAGDVDLKTTITTMPLGTTKDKAIEMLQVALTPDEETNGFRAVGKDAHRPFTMYGQLTAGSTNASGKKWTVQLHRIMARIQIQFGADGGGITGFVPDKVYLCNTNNKAMVFPKDLAADTEDGKYTTTPSIPSGDIRNTGYIEYDMTGKNVLNGQIYLFETAQPDKNPDPTKDEGRTCLVVSGYYDGDPKLSYYRVDLKAKEKDPLDENKKIIVYKDVLRNHTYTITVTGIKARGFANKEDAFEYPTDNMGTEIFVWNDGKTGNIDFVGDKFLGLGWLEYKVGKDATTINQAVTATKGLEWSAVLLETDANGNAIEGATPDWITFQNANNDKLTGTGTDNAEDIQLDVQDYPDNTGDRRAIIRFTAAGILKLEALVIQDCNYVQFIKVARSVEPETEITELEFEETAGKGDQLTISLGPKITQLHWKIETDADTGMKFTGTIVNGTNSTAQEGDVDVMKNGAKTEVLWTGIAAAVGINADYGTAPAYLKLQAMQDGQKVAEKTILLKQTKYGLAVDVESLIWCGGQTETIEVKGNMNWQVEGAGKDWWAVDGDWIEKLEGKGDMPENTPEYTTILNVHTLIKQLSYETKSIKLIFKDPTNTNRIFEKEVNLRGAYFIDGEPYSIHRVEGCLVPGKEGMQKLTLTKDDQGFVTKKEYKSLNIHEELLTCARQRQLNEVIRELIKKGDKTYTVGTIASDSKFKTDVSDKTITLQMRDLSNQRGWRVLPPGVEQTIENCPCGEDACGTSEHKFMHYPFALNANQLLPSYNFYVWEVEIDYSRHAWKTKSLEFADPSASIAAKWQRLGSDASYMYDGNWVPWDTWAPTDVGGVYQVAAPGSKVSFAPKGETSAHVSYIWHGRTVRTRPAPSDGIDGNFNDYPQLQEKIFVGYYVKKLK